MMVRAGQAPFGAVEIDDLDRRIVRLLRPNARRSYASMARALDVSEATVRGRVDRLIARGVILPMARVNPTAIGLPVDAMVGIRVARGYGKGVGARLAEMENVSYVGYTTGSFDLLIEVHLADNEGLYKFLNEDLEEIEGIAYTETWHILRTEKVNFEWEGESTVREPIDDGQYETKVDERPH
ncbi:MAG: Lrp/AsnC family transcriptional regulator [Thermoleophilia bacterium]|jgi:Lrp/AsnC family transcriptional regulator for asnA, asnC and gidA|nr:Lrp/AsnC family transcriptional regulator [Thermoleophilia bacterium]